MKLIIIVLVILLPMANAMNIVVSIPDFESILKEIAPDENITVILPKGTDPHSFSITKEVIDEIKGADLIILANSNLFSFEKNIKENWKEKEYLDIEDYNISLLDFDDFKKNPHGYWLYINNTIAIAFAIAKKLSQIEPEKEEYYIKNYEMLEKRLKEFEKLVIEISKDRGIYGKKVVAAVPGVCYIVKNVGMDADKILFSEGTSLLNIKEMEAIKEKLKSGEYIGIVAPEFLKYSKVGEVIQQIAEDTNSSLIFVKFAEGGDLINIFYYNLYQFSVEEKNRNEEGSLVYVLLLLLVILVIVEGCIIYKLYRRW